MTKLGIGAPAPQGWGPFQGPNGDDVRRTANDDTHGDSAAADRVVQLVDDAHLSAGDACDLINMADSKTDSNDAMIAVVQLGTRTHRSMDDFCDMIHIARTASHSDDGAMRTMLEMADDSPRSTPEVVKAMLNADEATHSNDEAIADLRKRLDRR